MSTKKQLKKKKNEKSLGQKMKNNWFNFKNALKNFWKNNEQKIVLAVAMIFLAIISFEVGALKGQGWKQSPLIIEKPEHTLVEEIAKMRDNRNSHLTTELFASSSNLASANNSFDDNLSTKNEQKNCVFVASKNSKKYHKTDCRWSKRILEKNRICFKSEEDAKSKGFVPASCMK